MTACTFAVDGVCRTKCIGMELLEFGTAAGTHLPSAQLADYQPADVGDPHQDQANPNPQQRWAAPPLDIGTFDGMRAYAWWYCGEDYVGRTALCVMASFDRGLCRGLAEMTQQFLSQHCFVLSGERSAAAGSSDALESVLWQPA